MTRAVAKDEQSMYASLKEVAILFDRAQEQVFKLMAGVRSIYPPKKNSHRAFAYVVFNIRIPYQNLPKQLDIYR